MSEEERKAIHKMKRLLSYSKEHEYFSPFQEQEIDDMDIVLKLVENQQKEIEELKSIASEFTNRKIEQFSIGEFNFKVKHFKDNYIHKDKIREIIEHYNNELEHIKNGEEFENEKPMYYWGKVALENLLEEN